MAAEGDSSVSQSSILDAIVGAVAGAMYRQAQSKPSSNLDINGTTTINRASQLRVITCQIFLRK